MCAFLINVYIVWSRYRLRYPRRKKRGTENYIISQPFQADLRKKIREKERHRRNHALRKRKRTARARNKKKERESKGTLDQL